MPNENIESKKQFIVIALTGSDGDKHQGCRIVDEDAIYPAIFSRVYGPASREQCQQWIKENCDVAAKETEINGLLGIKPVEAAGYSESFSFDEAFQNAVANLPPDDNDFPDKLTTVTVLSTGAEYGGIAGIRRMKVVVSAVY
ncbi:MAG TPA: hypothetical protein VGC76_17690 [Pyrinomonadaceae bacterium]|jgi:hypothetical protein